jgi:putative ABC transport system permease protein
VVQPIVIPESITGVHLDEFSRMSGGLRYLAGGGFSKPDDVLVDEYYARQHKLSVGSRLDLLNRDWNVAGIVEPGKLSRIFVALPVLQELTGNRGKLSQIYLKLADESKVDEMANHLRTGIPELTGYQIYTTEQLASLISIDNVPGIKAFITVIVGLAVVIGFLVVFLAMYTAVLERTREIGILKALGASPMYILTVLLRETAVLAMAGSIVGIGLSFVTRWVIDVLVPASLQQKVVPEWWPLTALIAVVGAGLGTMYPAWKAAKQDAIEALAYD